MRSLKHFGSLAQREAKALHQLPTDGGEDFRIALQLRCSFYAVHGTKLL